MYASVDPFYMIMLMHNLGPEYIVWDKAAAIRFKKPGKSRLFARFFLDESELQFIRQELLTQPKLDRVYRVELADAAGEMYAWVDKTIYLARNPDKHA